MSVTDVTADVAVVGGGPAGAVTALLLARAGVDVAVVERRPMPRPKPCGDCLSARAAHLLERLGLMDAVLATRPARLRGWRIFSPAGHSFESRFADVCGGDARLETAFAVPRDRLDAVLLDAAVAAGARVLTPVHVHTVTADNVLHARAGGEDVVRIRSRLVVGADGLRSVVARSMGAPRRPARRRKLSLTAHVTGLERAARFGEMHVIEGACLGIAPVHESGNLHNVTLVVESARAGRDVAAGAEAFFRRWLARFPAVDGALDDVRVRAPLLASGPFDFPVSDTVADGRALVGDAAGYFDPFTGQGIYQAMASAELLAEEAAAALAAGDVSAARLARYSRRRRALLRGTRLVQRIIDEVLARPALADRAIARLRERPPVAGALLAVTGDLRPASSLAAPGLLLRFLAPSLTEPTR